MKKKIPVSTACILVLLAVLLTFQITYSFVGFEYQAKVDTLTKTQSDFSLLAQADGLIRENFYTSFDDESVEKGLISGYISALSDPYSKYLSVEEYSRYQKEKAVSGNGIGVRLTWDGQEKKIYVCDTLLDSPAREAGLVPGDEIIRVNGKSAQDLGFYGVLTALSAEEGSEVSLDIKRTIATQVLDMTFTCQIGKISASNLTWEWIDNGVAYVRIYNFAPGTEKEFDTALNSILGGNAKGLVIDVRNTSDGDANTSIKMLDRLLGEGILIRCVNEKGETKEIKSDKNSFDIKTTLLINENTSFAAEIFAAVLKDFDAAVLVGETSFGKSIGQKVLELDDGSALILSNITYTPPISPSFEKVGVEPDIKCKLSVENFYFIEKEQDSQLMAAYQALLS